MDASSSSSPHKELLNEESCPFRNPMQNPEAVTSFFNTVFGWEFQQWGDEEYYMTAGGNPAEPGIGGAIMKRKDPNQPLVNTIEVEDIDATLAVITAHGGSVAVEKFAVGEMGQCAYFTDPDGGIHGLWQQTKQP